MSGDSGITASAFKHNPLDITQPSIRLIRILQKPSREGLIRCEISHTTMDSKYTCLSYCWGELDDGGGPFSILINNRRYEVRQNLLKFLHYARTKYDSLLWIDALCIDQDNTAERNHQVQQMGKIYSSAKEVLAWLGDDQDAAAYLRYLHLRAEYKKLSFLHRTQSALSETGQMSPLAKPKQTRSLLHLLHPSFRSLFNNWFHSMSWDRRLDRFVDKVNNYWRRAWVTQEILLARRVTFMAGSAMAEAKALKRLHRSVHSFRFTESSPGLGQLLHVLAERDGPVQKFGLLGLLELMQSKDCTIVRDRLYSLLALCREGSVISVDYQLSNRNFLLGLLGHYRDSTCLCTTGLLSNCVPHPDVNDCWDPKDKHHDSFVMEITLKNISPQQRAFIFGPSTYFRM